MSHPSHYGRVFSAVRCIFAVFLLVLLLAPQIQAHGHKRETKTGILIVAFGTSIPEAKAAYENIDAMVKKEFPGVPVHWAYTSKIIRHKLAGEGKEVFSPAEALAQMADQDFTQVAVQSLHLIAGEEYHCLVGIAHAFEGMPKGMERVLVGYPLLATSEDLVAAAKTIREIAPERGKGEALVLMGHGTHHPGDVNYAAMQYHFDKLGKDVIVGTVEGCPTLDDVLGELQERGFAKATLMPMMAVAGDHARNDMAGDEPDSWKSVLTSKGVECKTVIKGLAENEAMAKLWIGHLRAVMAHFK